MKSIKESIMQESLVNELYTLFDLSCEESDLVACLDELDIQNAEDFDKVFLCEENQYDSYQELEDDMLDFYGEVLDYFTLNGLIFSTNELDWGNLG